MERITKEEILKRIETRTAKGFNVDDRLTPMVQAPIVRGQSKTFYFHPFSNYLRSLLICDLLKPPDFLANCRSTLYSQLTCNPRLAHRGFLENSRRNGSSRLVTSLWSFEVFFWGH